MTRAEIFGKRTLFLQQIQKPVVLRFGDFLTDRLGSLKCFGLGLASRHVDKKLKPLDFFLTEQRQSIHSLHHVGRSLANKIVNHFQA